MRGAWFGMLALVAAAPADAEGIDDAAITKLEVAQEAAWNGHDARAYAALFTPDAELVTSRGTVLHGSAEIERRSDRDFVTVFATSKIRLGEVHLRPLGPDTTLARVNWSYGGVPASSGEERRDRQMVQTQVLVRTNGSWRIIALQDTFTLDDAAGEQSEANAPPPRPAPAVTTPRRRCVVGRSNGECLIYGKQ